MANGVPYEQRPDVLAFRVETNESRLGVLENWRRDVDRDGAARAERDKNTAEALLDLTNEVRGLRRMFLTFILTAAGSALAFGLSILAATGRI